MNIKRNQNNSIDNNLSIDSNPSPIKKVKNHLDFSKSYNEDDEPSNDLDLSFNTSNISNLSNINGEEDNDDDDRENEPKDIDNPNPSITTTTATSTNSTLVKKTNNFLDFNFAFEPNKEEDDEEEDLNISLTTEDILLSQIELLKAEWDYITYNKSPPLVLQSVYHQSNKDSERSIQILKKKGTIRLFQIATSLNDYCIIITTDYIKNIELLKIENTTIPNKIKPETLTNNMKNSSPIKSAPIDTILLKRSEILDLFIKKLIPNFNEVSITRSKLFQLLSIVNDDHHQQENIITHLVQCGLLLQKDDCTFTFSVPGAGGFFLNLMKGRKEILSNIQRLKYKEILKKDLLKKKLKYSNVQMQLLIKDLLGLNKIKIIPTTQGELIRCVQFDEL
ncbi:hypothetical protein DDB_G0279761 [Dictyostelium discoideum AX4]|uniref:Winged helix repair factor 1 n=1 Tax=Dictyostelium discoideum TaxID=44689 RepID=WHR1_DICDI|nr:hypothetical protein DDB_G0279761 [Dictyostelium discoideum AX4]Q54WC0.1 RecName: Full=Serine/threonine-protein kinase 19 homolog [Dictyostelium discoideum]EAL67560.1 hypothetical protein DDB_G0279761 [Dictyostelium discoideum AX4]|eukprot:XP_641538.1 hypothetical protein DDB_G0279761 [Dictyostelium discoideum AX4]